MNVGNSPVYIMQYFKHKYLESAGNNLNLEFQCFYKGFWKIIRNNFVQTLQPKSLNSWNFFFENDRKQQGLKYVWLWHILGKVFGLS